MRRTTGGTYTHQFVSLFVEKLNFQKFYPSLKAVSLPFQEKPLQNVQCFCDQILVVDRLCSKGTPSTESPSSHHHQLNKAAVVGGSAAGGALLLLSAAAVVIWLLRRRRRAAPFSYSPAE